MWYNTKIITTIYCKKNRLILHNYKYLSKNGSRPHSGSIKRHNHSGSDPFFLIFIAQKVSNIHLVTKDFKIVPLNNLLKLFLAGQVIGGGGLSC